MRPRFIWVSADVMKGLGDWLMSLPAVALARRVWPQAEFVCICPSHFADLAIWTQLFDFVRPYTPDWFRDAELLHGATFVLSLLDDNKPLADEVGEALKRHQVRTAVLRNRHYETRQHHAEMLVKNLSVIGVDQPAQLPYPLAIWGERAKSRVVAIHAGYGHLWKPGLKNWPSFDALMQQLEQEGWQVLQILGPDEPTGNPAHPALRASLPEVAERLLDCQAFIGNDSGIAHLAGALGLPTLTLFGFTDAWLWHPIGPRVSWFEAPDKDLRKLSVAEVMTWQPINSSPRAFLPI